VKTEPGSAAGLVLLLGRVGLILVRADKWTEWHYIGKFMTACSQPYAQFWKLELAMSEVDKEAKMFARAARNK